MGKELDGCELASHQGVLESRAGSCGSQRGWGVAPT